jgi:hypothetical protein
MLPYATVENPDEATAKPNKKTRALSDSGFLEFHRNRQSGTAGGLNRRAFRPPVLPFGRPTIDSRLLRWPRVQSCVGPRIRPRSVILRPLITFGSTTVHRRTRSFIGRPIGLSIGLPISGCCTNFEFVQFVPLFIGAIPFRDSSKFANPATRINRFWIIHASIMNHTAGLIQYSRKIKSQKNSKRTNKSHIQPYNSHLF